MKKLSELPADGGAESHLIGPAKGDGKLTFDKLTDLYHSGTRHEEDQPAHLIIHDTNICESRCVVEYEAHASDSVRPTFTKCSMILPRQTASASA